MSLDVALCLWGLTSPPVVATRFAVACGFQSVDVRPGYSEMQVVDRLLPVTCMAVAHLMPDGAALDATDRLARLSAVEHVRHGLFEAQVLGVPDIYLSPPDTADESNLSAYRASVLTLAEEAYRVGVRVGIEHFPGRGLATVNTTLDFISDIDHSNLYLLLDIGHNQIASESVPEAIEAAGDRLLYVHVNDNDGRNDMHLGLLEGMQCEGRLQAALQAVAECPYVHSVSIEVSSKLDDPQKSIRNSLDILRRLQTDC
mgnify:CR=1 FL=1